MQFSEYLVIYILSLFALQDTSSEYNIIQNEEVESDDDREILNDIELKPKRRAYLPWFADEKKRLNELVKDDLKSVNEKINWSDIAQKLGTQRSAASVQTNYRKFFGKLPKKKSQKSVLWTKTEENELRKIVDGRADKNSNDWEQIAKEFNAKNKTKRTEKALQARYNKILRNERTQSQKLFKSRVIFSYFCADSDEVLKQNHQFSTRVPKATPSTSPDMSEHLCNECDSKLIQMDVDDVYPLGFYVYCNGANCKLPKRRFGRNDTVYHCSNGHDYCSQCGAPKAIKIELKEQTQNQTDSEEEIEIINGDGWDYKQSENNKAIDIDDDIKLKPKINKKCPISLEEMVNPYKSTRCGHIYEKDAVLSYMKSYRKKPNKRKDSSVPCPIPGCSKKIKEEYLEAVNKKKRRRSSFDINHLPLAKKTKFTSFVQLLPPLC